ncbi:hypothetical protein [Streptomyces sp. NBC_01361]|uniref:hypothetical protein n=1 Tax=Streptomyces sp. NBC_01361 TaxID=2903838 RepID=UPI002E364F37|nr:hypothetical protein [Streptomyces sp. NBC_01361]
MLTSHSVDGDALHVTLHHHLDVNSRAAAAVEIEALVHTRQPCRVTVQIPAGEPTPATLSVLVHAHRTCKNLNIPLSLTGATTAAQRLFTAQTPPPAGKTVVQIRAGLALVTRTRPKPLNPRDHNDNATRPHDRHTATQRRRNDSPLYT